MNNQDQDRGIVPPNNFEPFPEPQTIPSGWDLSELLSAPGPAPESEAGSELEN